MHGQYWLMYATKKGGRAVSMLPLSEFTSQLVKHLNSVGSKVIFPDTLARVVFVHNRRKHQLLAASIATNCCSRTKKEIWIIFISFSLI